MNKQDLLRWGGFLALGTALLLLLGAGGVLFGLPLAVPAFALAHLLLNLVIVAIYAPQVHQTGWLGLLGFVAMLLGNVLFFANQVGGLPSLGPLPGPAFLTLGLLPFAIANARAGILPKFAGWLMFLGLSLNLIGGQVHWPDVVTSILAPVINGGGIGWFGLGLTSRRKLLGMSAASDLGAP